jgi:hypothetical protein
MRERLAALDGNLAAGPDPDGGFHLCARIPVDRSGRTGGDSATPDADRRRGAA